jgi:hypothetical protein
LALVGAGWAAAALVRRRRSADTPTRGEPQWTQLQGKTLAQIDLAIALLEGRAGQPRERTVHEARKALKRARALVRLQREALGRKRFAATNKALRNAGRGLAEARDAEVMVDALDSLVKRHPKQLATSKAVAKLRRELVAQRERMHAQTQAGAPARAAIVEQLRITRTKLARWELPAGGERAGLERIYRQGRQRRRRARRERDGMAMHQWRKRVKDLRYVAEALECKQVARRADRLGETIGEEHDLLLLAGHIRRQRGCFKGEQATRRTLEKLIDRRRRRLQRRAWHLGDELYMRKPKRFARRALRA